MVGVNFSETGSLLYIPKYFVNGIDKHAVGNVLDKGKLYSTFSNCVEELSTEYTLLYLVTAVNTHFEID